MNGYVKRDKDVLAQSHSNENIYRTAPRAPIPLQDTIIPLMAEEVITMEIHASKKDCKLKFKAGKKKLYYIKKVLQKDFLDIDPDKRITYFFASLSPHFTSSGDQAIDRRYIDQIGNSYAVKGEVMFVDVNMEDKLKPGSETEYMQRNARNCGVSTALMALNMVDPDLNVMSMSRMKKVFRDNRELRVAIRAGCQRFIGWLVQANPASGAYGYFSAALRTGYNKILIKRDHTKKLHGYVINRDHTKTLHGEDGVFVNARKVRGIRKFRWIDVKKARDCFDHTTGLIGRKGHGGIQAMNKDWWFCDEKPGDVLHQAVNALSLDYCMSDPCFVTWQINEGASYDP